MIWFIVGFCLMAIGVTYVLIDTHRAKVRYEQAEWERIRRRSLEEE